jgi:2-iminobutanoate/2-iminopropanoate deaminase
MTAREPIQTDAAPAAIGPYSQAVRAGGLVFTAGQVGVDPTTKTMADGVAAQAEQALRNLVAILTAAGTGLDRVIKTTIFLADMADFATVNEAYAAAFTAPYPARSTVAVCALPLGALVEIECVALAADAAPPS